MEKFLDRHNVDSKGFFGFSKTIRYREGILEEGEMFTVAGEGQWNKTVDHNLMLTSKNVLVLIPGKENS